MRGTQPKSVKNAAVSKYDHHFNLLEFLLQPTKYKRFKDFYYNRKHINILESCISRPIMNTNNTAAQEARRKIQKNNRDNGGLAKNPKSDLTKYVDISSNSVVSSTAVLTLLNGVASGSDFYQRINRAINCKELKLKLSFTQHATAVGWYAADSARVIVVWDHQADASPAAADLLLDVSAGGATTTTNLSAKNINNKERFIFLADRNIHLPSYSITTVNQINTINSAHRPNNDEWIQTFNIKLDSLVTRFNSTGSAITDINSGALHLFVLGAIAPGSSGWRVAANARFSFFDS